MKKMELVAQLQAARSLSSQVDIDKVIELINSLDDVKTVTTLSSELIEELSNKIERCLDNNCNDLVNKDDATFSIGYGNVIELDDAEINVYEIMEHINEVLVQFETEEDEDEAAEEIIDGEDVSNQVTVY